MSVEVLRMKFFLDSAHMDEIGYALDMWDIDGVTTNPKHVQVTGKPFLTVIQEIGQLFEGTDKPISVEVNPHYEDWQDMVAEDVIVGDLDHAPFLHRADLSPTRPLP